ncbi:ribosome silencing factor [Actinomarinicola tropica]|uniref:Ribosomal silencing factor RsfS n=1 Tax=Actinomarinicola tropica TaxID=2789776 RepID=A0A5Q2RR66_9ACTN|nr:ribosome silencing factor [Actinomarinicola tropica]QGG95685.1 ribosome silencing factor [Actinomarinicola tropica]
MSTEHDTDTDPTHWALLAARAAAAKGGNDPVVLDVGSVVAITGAFVIVSAGNSRLVRTLVDEVEAKITEAGGPKPRRVEGRDTLQWVLVDYGDFVVHVFDDEARAFYELERLWSDVPRLEWDEPPAAAEA